MHMTADFDKPYTDWSIDVGSYKYEGITNFMVPMMTI